MSEEKEDNVIAKETKSISVEELVAMVESVIIPAGYTIETFAEANPEDLEDFELRSLHMMTAQVLKIVVADRIRFDGKEND